MAKQSDTLYTTHKVQGQLGFVPKVAWNCSSLLCVCKGSFISKANTALCKQQRIRRRRINTGGTDSTLALRHARPQFHGCSSSFRGQGRVCGGAQGGRVLSSFITRVCLIWKDAQFLALLMSPQLMKLRRLDFSFHPSRSQFFHA